MADQYGQHTGYNDPHYDAQQYAQDQYELDRQQKQQYLQDEIVNQNYDTSEFAKFMNSKKENGTSIDNWSFASLQRQVSHFKRTQVPGYDQSTDLELQKEIQMDVQEEKEAAEWHRQQQLALDAGQTPATQSVAPVEMHSPDEYNTQTLKNDISQSVGSFVEPASESQSPSAQQQEETKKEDLGGFENDDSNYEDIEEQGTEFSRMKSLITNIDGCPQLEVRDFIKCRKLEDVKTALNFKRVTVKVPNNEVKKGGWFQSDYSLFDIETSLNGQPTYKVQRRDEEFYLLRKVLKKQFPYILVPPLPLKNGKLVEKILIKRQKQFARFLQAVVRSEVLKTSQFLYSFLQVSDQKNFATLIKLEEKNKYSKSIEEFVVDNDGVNDKGLADIQLNKNAVEFAGKMQTYIDSHQLVYQEVIDQTQTIATKVTDLATSLNNLAKVLQQISELNKLVKIDRQVSLYTWLSRMVGGQMQFLQNTTELIKLYCGSHLKFHCAEAEGMREICAVMTQLRTTYLKRERSLLEKKEQLFKKRDATKWLCTAIPQAVLMQMSEQLYNDKERAFKHIMTEETRQVGLMREELSFYMNMCLHEMQRIGADNGTLLTDHFITMSQIQCAYINQHHINWVDFNTHFASLGTGDVTDASACGREAESQARSASVIGAGMERKMTAMGGEDIFANALSRLATNSNGL